MSLFDAIRRKFRGDPLRTDWRGITAWARSEGNQLKRVRDGDGFVVEGHFEGEAPWRLEWGPSQRAYIASRELRLRVEGALPPDLQMLVLAKSLAEKLERETFEQFTQTTQTYVDTSAPEEMRWLTMFPRAALAGPKSLRSRFSAVAMEPAAASSWVDKELAGLLADASMALLAGDPPLVLMTLRGRVYLRVEMPQAEPARLADALAIGAAALDQARRIARFRVDTGEWQATTSTASQSASTQGSQP